MLRLTFGSASFLVAMMTATVLFGQQPAAKPAGKPIAATQPAAITDLVLGDEYVIESKRGDSMVEMSGTLVKANDHWIVLHSTTRDHYVRPHDCAEAVKSGKMPIIRVRDSHERLWIPRDAATICGRTLSRGKVKVAPIKADAPASSMVYLGMVEGGESIRREGEFGSMNDQQVVLTSIPGLQARNGASFERAFGINPTEWFKRAGRSGRTIEVKSILFMSEAVGEGADFVGGP